MTCAIKIFARPRVQTVSGTNCCSFIVPWAIAATRSLSPLPHSTVSFSVQIICMSACILCPWRWWCWQFVICLHTRRRHLLTEQRLCRRTEREGDNWSKAQQAKAEKKQKWPARSYHWKKRERERGQVILKVLIFWKSRGKKRWRSRSAHAVVVFHEKGKVERCKLHWQWEWNDGSRWRRKKRVNSSWRRRTGCTLRCMFTETLPQQRLMQEKQKSDLILSQFPSKLAEKAMFNIYNQRVSVPVRLTTRSTIVTGDEKVQPPDWKQWHLMHERREKREERGVE